MRAWTEIGLVWILHILWSNISHSFSTFPTIFVGNNSQRLNNFIYQLQQARMAELEAHWLSVPEIQVQTPHVANEYEQIFLSLSHIVPYNNNAQTSALVIMLTNDD